MTTNTNQIVEMNTPLSATSMVIPPITEEPAIVVETEETSAPDSVSQTISPIATDLLDTTNELLHELVTAPGIEVDEGEPPFKEPIHKSTRQREKLTSSSGTRKISPTRRCCVTA